MSDREINREEVEPLLRNSPIRERIDYLLDNQDLGSNKLVTLQDGPFVECKVYPNCFGTALFVLGKDREFAKQFGLKEKGEAVFYVDRSRDFVVFSKNFNGPGSLQERYMDFFLETLCEKSNSPVNEGIVVTQGVGRRGVYHDTLHSAVYLGEIDRVGYVFEQNGLGAEFRFDLFNRMVNKNGITGHRFYRVNNGR